MSEKQEAFPETTKTDWQAAARKELSGNDPLAKLSFQAGDLTFLPYYDDSDIPASTEQKQIGAAGMWVNAPRIVVSDSHEANRAALEHLQEGADGILFEIINDDANVADLFSGIELPFCSIYFCGNASVGFMERFGHYAAKKFDPSQIRGAVYGLTVDGIVALQPAFETLTQFCIYGAIHDKPAMDVGALALLLKELQDRFAIAHKETARLPHTALLLTISDDFFGEIIRIHALSTLWRGFQEAYGDSKPRLSIHAWSRPMNDSAFEPHGNMISSVARAVSGVLGGANILTVEPQTSEPLQSRTARNVSFILQEESQLARASHMVAGAYYIEAAAQKLAEETWSKFQTLVRK